MLTTQVFAAWLDRYRTAWEQRDPAAAAALFTADATYRETPFDPPPFEGREAIRDYWARTVAGQRDVRFSSDVLACADDRGICHWNASFTAAATGAKLELDGIFHCRFADDEHVSSFEEWWHLKMTPAD